MSNKTVTQKLLEAIDLLESSLNKLKEAQEQDRLKEQKIKQELEEIINE